MCAGGLQINDQHGPHAVSVNVACDPPQQRVGGVTLGLGFLSYLLLDLQGRMSSIGVNLRGVNLREANLRGANLRGANLREANLRGANLRDAKVGQSGEEAELVGSRPVVQIGPIGSRNDWLLVFWCGDAGVRISTGCQQQITEAYFLERLADAHGEGEQANIHAQHYLEALAFAKRLLKDQADEKL